MTLSPTGGTSSGNFRETSGRVQILHVVTRNSAGTNLTGDAFTQANPPIVTTQVSAQLTGITKRGILGSTVCFTRPDFANGYVGGPVAPGGVYNAKIKPLGIFINDALGNPFENAPGVASGMGPYLCGNGTSLAISLWETKVQLGGGAGTIITYSPGDTLYASINGLLTNVPEDAYEWNVVGQNSLPFLTQIATVSAISTASFNLMAIKLRGVL